MGISKTVKEVFAMREDLSQYVYHFTKNRNAKDILENILCDRAIKDVKRNKYICFTEAPITMLPSMFRLFKKNADPMYAPYGVGIRKEYLYKLGGRPVIYGTSDDKKMLPKELQWRFVYLYPDSYDFSWLREWRIPAAQVDLTYENCFAVVDTKKDYGEMQDEFFFELDDIEIDSQPEDGGVLTEYTGYFSRKFKAVTMEEIEEVNNMTKQQLEDILSQQVEQYGCSLGSIWE